MLFHIYSGIRLLKKLKVENLKLLSRFCVSNVIIILFFTYVLCAHIVQCVLSFVYFEIDIILDFKNEITKARYFLSKRNYSYRVVNNV